MQVKLPNGGRYNVTSLLSDGDSNTKLAKSNSSGKGYLTYGLSLAPANLSGYEVCPSRSPGCSAACLNYAGMGQINSVQTARIAKTVAWFEERQWFTETLQKELALAQAKANRQGKLLAVRLNVLSDIMWEKMIPKMFGDFGDVTFYDYTKIFKRALKFAQGKRPPNYTLTFSRSENNQTEAIKILKAGGTVAVVFNSKTLPAEWEGYPVINGDETDLRFLDSPQTVVGLYAKGRGNKDTSGFVVSAGRILLTTV